jgi:hypothetical protein
LAEEKKTLPEEGGKFGTSQIMPATQSRKLNTLSIVEFSGDYAGYDLEAFGNELVIKSEQADSESVQTMLDAS